MDAGYAYQVHIREFAQDAAHERSSLEWLRGKSTHPGPSLDVPTHEMKATAFLVLLGSWFKAEGSGLLLKGSWLKAPGA